MSKDQAKLKARTELLLTIAEKWNNHNFIGEILDDRWVEGVCAEVGPHYLTNEETDALAEMAEDGDSPLNLATAVVERSFVLYLCRVYGIGPVDLLD